MKDSIGVKKTRKKAGKGGNSADYLLGFYVVSQFLLFSCVCVPLFVFLLLSQFVITKYALCCAIPLFLLLVFFYHDWEVKTLTILSGSSVRPKKIIKHNKKAQQNDRITSKQERTERPVPVMSKE